MKPEQLTLAAAALQQEEEEPECELQAALDRARRLRLAHRHHTEIVPKVCKHRCKPRTLLFMCLTVSTL